MSDEYYYLKAGDIIQDGDEVDICNDGWRDNPKWEASTRAIGMPAPDPCYPSHRKYRRKNEKKIVETIPDQEECPDFNTGWCMLEATRQLYESIWRSLKLLMKKFDS